MKNPLDTLKGGKKTAGLSRKAWVVLLLGAVVLGLYLRHRRAAAAAAAGTTDTTAAGGGSLTDQSGADSGLAGVGVAAAPGGSVVPYNQSAAEIPQGIIDIATGQQALLADYATRDNAPNAVDNGNAPVSIFLPGSGGGPPKVPNRTVAGSRHNQQQYRRIAQAHPGKAGAAIRARAKKRLHIG